MDDHLFFHLAPFSKRSSATNEVQEVSSSIHGEIATLSSGHVVASLSHHGSIQNLLFGFGHLRAPMIP
ncbi:hypothetical protein AAC387_Pa07g1926 [Persea americana]